MRKTEKKRERESESVGGREGGSGTAVYAAN